MKYLERNTQEAADALVAELQSEGKQAYWLRSGCYYTVRYWG